MAKDLEYYLAQARRIAEHREEGAEKAIRKEFRELLKSLKAYIADVHEKYAADDGSLSYADLQKAGYDARFLEEIERRISVATPKVSKELHQLVNDTYELSYKAMIEGVDKVVAGTGIEDVFPDAVAITPEQIMKVVKNPVMEVALEKNHRDIVYDIKQAVAVGLMNGDRYATIAQKISVALDKENGPYKNAMRIARTEAHRVREAGNKDAAETVDKELKSGKTGMRMCKTWRTMKDERVRPQRRRRGKKGGWTSKMGTGPNHMKLECQTVLADEPFDLLDGNKAEAPGQSGVAGHDINCRCYVSYEMMTDAEFFAKTGKHFPGWKKAETIENTGESGIMDARVFARFYEGEDVNNFFYYEDGKRGSLAKSSSEYEKWKSSLSDDTKGTLYGYMATGYDDINNYLRKTNGWKSINSDAVEKEIKQLDKAIASFNLKDNIVVMRGAMNDSLDMLYETYDGIRDMSDYIGKKYRDNGFMSTTALMGSMVAASKPVVFEISIPSGKGRGAYINELSSLYKDAEYEFLIKRGAEFTISDVYEDIGTGKIYVKMVMDVE